MTIDDDLVRSGRAIASSTTGDVRGTRVLRARRRRARVIGGAALALVALAGSAGLVLADDENDRITVDTVDETPSTRIEPGAGASTVTGVDGTPLGALAASDPGGDDPVLDRVMDEVLDDPTVADHLRVLGVTGDRDARAALLADAGLVVETAVRPDALDAARRSVAEATDAAGGPYTAAIASIDPTTGEVVALAGPVSTVEAPAGSAFQPFAMAAALEGGVGADEQIPAPVEYTMTVGGAPWTVRNFGGVGTDGVTLAEAVAQSLNTPWLALLDAGRLDPELADQIAGRLGITRPSGRTVVLADVLGAGNVRPIELAGAYAGLATAGRPTDVHIVRRVLGADGAVLYDAATRPTVGGDGLEADVAVQVRSALEQAMCCGEDTAAAALGDDVAQFGQPGTLWSGDSAWFAGSTPDLTTVVFTGRAGSTTGSLLTGGGLPAEVWRTYMVQAADPADRDFPH